MLGDLSPVNSVPGSNPKRSLWAGVEPWLPAASSYLPDSGASGGSTCMTGTGQVSTEGLRGQGQEVVPAQMVPKRAHLTAAAALLGQPRFSPDGLRCRLPSTGPANLDKRGVEGGRGGGPRAVAQAPHFTPAHTNSLGEGGRTSRLNVIPLPRHIHGDPQGRVRPPAQSPPGTPSVTAVNLMTALSQERFVFPWLR